MPNRFAAVPVAALLAFSVAACDGQRDAGQQDGFGDAGTGTTEVADPGLAPGGPGATGSGGVGGMGAMPPDTMGPAPAAATPGDTGIRRP